MAESLMCDIEGRTSFASTDGADETVPTPLGNEELLDSEGQSQCEKVLSCEIQPEDHAMTNDTEYNFEDEEAWIEGVFKIIWSLTDSISHRMRTFRTLYRTLAMA